MIGKWLLTVGILAGSAFCSGTETALTALGDARARQLRDRGGRRPRLLGLWVEHPERVLATLLIGNTLMSVGAGALAAALSFDVAAARVSAYMETAPATSVSHALGMSCSPIMLMDRQVAHPKLFWTLLQHWIALASHSLCSIHRSTAIPNRACFRTFSRRIEAGIRP
jgi:CBS domain containing-hemolysin-like protein